MWGWILAGLVGAYIGSKCSSNEVYYVIQDPCKSQREFFDLYRKVDYRLGAYVNQNSGGVGLLISNLRCSKRDYDSANALDEVRQYRNLLAHNRNRWDEMPDPTQQMFNVLAYILQNIGYFGGLVKDQRRYLIGCGKWNGD